MRRALTVLLTASMAAGCAGACTPDSGMVLPAGRLVDLSHAYDEQTIFWPTAERFTLETVSHGYTEAGFFYAANNLRMAEHGGTHIDAPVHFAEGRQTVDQIPLDRLLGPAVVVDVTEQSARDADYRVTVDDLLQTEAADGPIPDGAILLIRTGFSSRWPDAGLYLGTAERGGTAVEHLRFPGLHPDAARWLADNRSIAAAGIDTASIDHGRSTLFEAHRALHERNIPAFENLTNLDQLPPRGAYVIALPMKIAGGSGGPLRAIAIVP